MTAPLLYLALGAALMFTTPEPSKPGLAQSKVVIPPSAASALRAVLGAEAGKIDGRLVLQQAQVDRDSVIALFGQNLDSQTMLKIRLSRTCPGSEQACLAAGPFMLVAQQGDDKAAIEALVRRLERLKPEQVWKTIPKEVEVEEPAVDDGANDEALARAAQLTLLKAEHAALIGQPDKAKEMLMALGTAPDTATSMLLNIAEALWGIEAIAEAKSVVTTYQERSQASSDPAGKWRAKALSGEPVSVPEILNELIESDAACSIHTVARSMSVTGGRQQGYLLLEGAAPKTDCIDIEVTMARWFAEDKRMSEAQELTGVLMAHAPDNDEVRSLRAQSLMANSEFKEAAKLLEAAAWKDPDSGLLSSLIGAYQRIEDPAWQDQKLAELEARATRDANDHVAAFLVGVKLHYRGDFAQSDQHLTRVAATFHEQPRLHIYRGMNAFNLGERDRALEHIETAMTLEAPDPDVYYCRAELRRWFDVKGSIEDLNRYLVQSHAGGTTNPAKQERVNRIIRSLEGCIERGDPIPCEAPFEHPRGHEANRDPFASALGDWTWAHTLKFSGVALLLFLIVRQRRINQRQQARWS